MILFFLLDQFQFMAGYNAYFIQPCMTQASSLNFLSTLFACVWISTLHYFDIANFSKCVIILLHTVNTMHHDHKHLIIADSIHAAFVSEKEQTRFLARQSFIIFVSLSLP